MSPLVVAYFSDSDATIRLQHALKNSHRVVACATQEEVLQQLTANLCDCLLIDRTHRDGTLTIDFVEVIHRRFPSIAVILYCKPLPALFREILEFSRAGVHDLVLRGVDDVRSALRRIITVAVNEALESYTMALLDAHLRPRIREIVQICIRGTHIQLNVEQLAEVLGVTRKTLATWCRTEASPGPEHMIGWSRLVRAARMLQDPGRSVEEVAYGLGFGSASALSNMFRRYVGEGPTRLRRNGGVRRVIELWAESFDRQD